MEDVWQIAASEAAKLVAAAAVGQLTEAVGAVARLVGRKLGAKPPSQEAILAAVRDDPAFGASLLEALSQANAGPAVRRVATGIEGFRDRELILNDPPVVGLRIISGAAGSGRTELARQLADRAQERYPSGRIELDLAALRTDGALDQALVKQRVLRLLGVPPSEIVLDDLQLDQQFVSVLTTNACTIILDNVVTAQELKPFLLFQQNHLILAITSVLTRDLAVLDRRSIRVDGLDDRGAFQLLADFAEPVSLKEEQVAVHDLLTLGGRMPAAIQQIGMTLAQRYGEQRPAAGLLADYRRDGLIGSEETIGTIMQVGFAELPSAAAQGAALLAGFPGQRFTRRTAIAYLGNPALWTAVLEARLTTPPDGEWHRLTTLVRQYAEQLPADRETALERLTDYLRDQAVAADLAGDDPGGPGRLREYDVPDGLVWELPDDRVDWLERHVELIGLVAEGAFERQRHREVCQLAGAVEALVNHRGGWREYAPLNSSGVESAAALYGQDAGYAALLARMLSLRARLNFLAWHFDPVDADLRRAWELAEGQAVANHGATPPTTRSVQPEGRLLSSVAEFRARYAEEHADALRTVPDERYDRGQLLADAEHWLRTAIGIDAQLADSFALGIHYRMLANVLVKAGRPKEALAEADRALANATGRNQVRAEMVAARACVEAGELVAARKWLVKARAGIEELGATQYTWELREIEAGLLTADGNRAGAKAAWAALLEDSQASKHPRRDDYLRRYEEASRSTGRRW